MRSDEEYRRSLALLQQGLSINAVARITGVPRGTVGYWSRTPGTRRRAVYVDRSWRPPNEAAYSYLLGAYLGDGNLAHAPRRRSADLRITLDAAYPALVAEVSAAITRVVPEVKVCRYEWPQRGRVVLLQATSPVWLRAFPQHGPGRKHLRPIKLEPWQEELTRRHPRELVRGLIHSDGCRCVNRFKTKLPSGRVAEYAYVRYFFSNLSEDIKDIFCEHAEPLGIRCSRANPRYVSISDRDSVAILDSFVGPKS
jgi:hypothetical protein